MTPKPLILIRHTEAWHHLEAITGGWTDSELTDLGREQARLLAARLQHELAGAALYLGASPLIRAIQTAEWIGSALGLAVNIHPLLADLNNGVAAGKSHGEARLLGNEPGASRLDWQPYPQAESWRQFTRRVAAFLEDFTARQETPAILVSHAATIHAMIAWWLGLGVESRTHFEIAPGSITVLRVNRWEERSLERSNDTAHLYSSGKVHPINLE